MKEYSEITEKLINELFFVNDDLIKNKNKIELDYQCKIIDHFIFIEIFINDFIEIECTKNLEIESIKKNKFYNHYKITFTHELKN
jgi:hypothetical protein